MRRIANGTQVAAMPTPSAAVGTPGFGTNGDPAAGQPSTIFDADQYNRIQEELIAVIAAAGLALDGNNNAQLLAALYALFPGLAAGGRSTTNPGHIRLPGGMILQWIRNLGALTNSGGAASVVFTYPVAFTNRVLTYSYCLTNEAAAYNDWTMVVGQPFLGQQGMSMRVPGAGAAQNVAISGFVLGV